jgi:Fic family protein
MVAKILQLLKTNSSFYEQVREDFTYHSSNIEGSTVTKEDHKKLSLLKPNQSIHDAHISDASKENDAIENLNCLKLFDHVFKNINEKLTHEVIKKYQFILKKGSLLHKNVPEETGEYRKTYVKAGSLEAIPPFLIYEKMDNLLKDFEMRKILLIDDIADFHFRYESIHPFRDGNGRTGRMITFKQCLENNLVPFIVNRETRSSYIDSLQAAQQQFNVMELTNYFLRQQKSFYEKYNNFFTKINDNTVLNVNEEKVMEYFKNHIYANRIEIQNHLGLKIAATKNLLAKMVKSGLLKINGESKNMRYTKA